MKVKELEWRQNPEGGESVIADIFGLTYQASVDVEGCAYWGFFRSMREPYVDVEGGLEEAKAAAQADFEQRVRSVLEE